MKHIYLVGFRGIGINNAFPGLIQLGHVGVEFEGDDKVYGFRPTNAAAEKLGGEEALIRYLRRHNSCDGALHDDTVIFNLAAMLSEQGFRTEVWQIAFDLADDEFENVYQQAQAWYTGNTIFSYTLPTIPPEADNCATFPRRLGLALPEKSGHLSFYIEELAERGTRWYPKGS